MLNINTEYNNEMNEWKVLLNGEVDIYTVKELKEKLKEILLNKKADIKIDCVDLSYIDSTGLGALISIQGKAMELGVKIILVNLKPNIVKLFHITGLDRIFSIE